MSIKTAFSRLIGSQNIVLILVVSLLAGAATFNTLSKKGLELVVEMQTHTDKSGEVFYNTGNGYTTQKRIAFELKGGNEFYQYHIPLPLEKIDSLRIDPGNAPGIVEVRSITMISVLTREKNVVPLEAIHLLNDLKPISIQGGILKIKSAGIEPHFDFEVTRFLRKVELDHKILAGTAAFFIYIITLFFGFLIPGFVKTWWCKLPTSLTIWLTKSGSKLIEGNPFHIRWPVYALLGILTAITFVVVAGILHFSTIGSGIFALQLLLGLSGFALIGGATLKVFRLQAANVSYGLATLSLLGQIVLFFYVYVRSAFNEYIIFVPLSHVELFIFVFVCAIIFIKNSDTIISLRVNLFLIFEGFLFFVIGYFIAERELPKLLMLSSDPDIHAFFAQQIETLGTIPYRRPEWGGEPFNYPAGSGVLIYIWASLSFLDVRNILASLPLLETAIAAVAIAEYSARNSTKQSTRIFVVISVVLLASVAFLMPLYQNYYHLEGAGRLISIGFVAFFMLLIFQVTDWNKQVDLSSTPIILVTLFGLAAINPANYFLPTISLFAMAMLGFFKARKFLIFGLLPFAAILLLILDPYFLGLISGRRAHSGIENNIPSFSLGEVNGSNLMVQAGRLFSMDGVRSMVDYLPSTSPQYFLIAILPILAFWLAVVEIRKTRIKTVGYFFIILLLCAFTLNLFSILSTTAPFYLLYPYFIFSLAQYKIALVLLVFAIAIIAGLSRSWAIGKVLVVTFFSIVFAGFIMRNIEPYNIQARKNYCGSMGCVTNADFRVFEKFRGILKRGETSAARYEDNRILLPNRIVQSANETWIMPMGGSRLVPYANIGPSAFYYFQGDKDYSVKTYREKVCEKFDLDWLKSHKIRYLFIPDDRNGICVANLDKIDTLFKVLIKDENSMILQLY